MPIDTQSIALLTNVWSVSMKFNMLPVARSMSVRIMKNVNEALPAVLYISAEVIMSRSVLQSRI